MNSSPSSPCSIHPASQSKVGGALSTSCPGSCPLVHFFLGNENVYLKPPLVDYPKDVRTRDTELFREGDQGHAHSNPMAAGGRQLEGCRHSVEAWREAGGWGQTEERVCHSSPSLKLCRCCKKRANSKDRATTFLDCKSSTYLSEMI